MAISGKLVTMAKNTMPPNASPKLKCEVIASIALVSLTPLIQMAMVENKKMVSNNVLEKELMFILEECFTILKLQFKVVSDITTIIIYIKH